MQGLLHFCFIGGPSISKRGGLGSVGQTPAGSLPPEAKASGWVMGESPQIGGFEAYRIAKKLTDLFT